MNRTLKIPILLQSESFILENAGPDVFRNKIFYPRKCRVRVYFRDKISYPRNLTLNFTFSQVWSSPGRAWRLPVPLSKAECPQESPRSRGKREFRTGLMQQHFNGNAKWSRTFEERIMQTKRSRLREKPKITQNHLKSPKITQNCDHPF